MSAGNDDGQDRRHNAPLASAGFGEPTIRDDPFLDLGSWKQKLAGDTAHRQRPFRRQFIDLSLFDAEHRGKLPGREELCPLFFPRHFEKIT